MPRRFLRSRQNKLLPALLEQMEPRCLLTLVLNGTPGDDHIVIAYSATDGELTIRMAPGYSDGTVLHGISDVEIDGGDGDDYLEVEVLEVYPYGRPGRPQYTTLRGGNGDDTLLGGNDYTEFDGGPGDDDIQGRASDGQQSRSGINYSGFQSPVNVRLDLGTIPDDGYGGHDTVSGVGEIYGTAGNDIIYAGPRNGWYYGQGGNDLLVASSLTGSNLVGGDGDDTLLGGDGPDLLDPGAGGDHVEAGGGEDFLVYYDYQGMTHGANIRLDEQTVPDDGTGVADYISDIENVYAYSNFGDTIVGDGRFNVLRGNDGPDFIYGGGGGDSLQGGQCATLLGGTGDDYLPTDYRFTFIDGGPGADTIPIWGWSDSQDQIITDSDDIVIDHRGATPTPPDMVKPPCEFLPYDTPVEPMPAGSTSEPPVLAAPPPAQKQTKPRRHHKHHKLRQLKPADISDLPIASRLTMQRGLNNQPGSAIPLAQL